MFEGFSDETFEFFMALHFNNNREFFHENHDQYMRSLRKPCLALCEALGETVHECFGLEIDVRPEKCLSRLNRDLRFTPDKTPYREYLWAAFRRPGREEEGTIGAYFDIGMNGVGYGIGFYRDNRPLMNGLRRRLREDPYGPARLVPEGFGIELRSYKRIPPLPEGFPTALAEWYRLRSFDAFRNVEDFRLIKSADLAEEIKAGYRALTPLFRYFDSISPEEDPAG